MRKGWELALISCATGCAFAGGGGGGGGSVPDAAAVEADGQIEGSPGVPCMTADACMATAAMGAVSGDVGADTLTATGYRAAWLRLRVTENNSGTGGKKLRVAAKLTSPAGVPFHIQTYVNMSTDAVECAVPAGMVTTTGNVDEVRLEWGEGGFANGADDSRDVSIEIHSVGSACATDRTWSLELSGNWQ